MQVNRQPVPVDEATEGWFNKTMGTRFLVPTRRGRKRFLLFGLGAMALGGLIMASNMAFPKGTVFDDTIDVEPQGRTSTEAFEVVSQQWLTLKFNAPTKIDICVGAVDQRPRFESGQQPSCVASSEYSNGSHGSMASSSGPHAIMIHNPTDDALQVKASVSLRSGVASYIFIAGLVLLFCGLLPGILSYTRIWKGMAG